jgi:hypothetical protein
MEVLFVLLIRTRGVAEADSLQGTEQRCDGLAPSDGKNGAAPGLRGRRVEDDRVKEFGWPAASGWSPSGGWGEGGDGGGSLISEVCGHQIWHGCWRCRDGRRRYGVVVAGTGVVTGGAGRRSQLERESG